MKLLSLELKAWTNSTPAATSGAVTSSAVSEVALYDTDGTQLTNYVSVNSAAGTFSIGSDDLLQDVVFTKDTYKIIVVKGRVSGTTTNWYFLQATSLVLEGLESTGTTSASALLANSTLGNYKLSSSVVEIKKNASSPSGSVSRGSAATYAIWDVTNPTGADVTITGITLTSKTGLPSGATSTTLYKLVDEAGNTIAGSANSVNTSAATVTFSSFSFTVPAGTSKQLRLVINTTDSDIWRSGTEMHWTVSAMTDVSGVDVGYAGTTWSIPADTNVVKL